MKVYYFSEFPYHEYPDAEGEKYPSLLLTFPNTYFDPEKGHQLFQRYFDECLYVDELGMEHLIFYGQESRMSHQATMSNIGLFGKEVLPAIQDW